MGDLGFRILTDRLLLHQLQEEGTPGWWELELPWEGLVYIPPQAIFALERSHTPAWCLGIGVAVPFTQSLCFLMTSLCQFQNKRYLWQSGQKMTVSLRTI